MAGLQIADFGECKKELSICGKTVNREDTCEDWEKFEKSGVWNRQSVINEITDITCRLHVVLSELNKIP